MNCLGRDEAALEIGMDGAGRNGRFLTGMNRPGPRLLFAGGEKRTQAEQMINRADKRMNAAVFHAQIAPRSNSATLQAKIVGFDVSKKKLRAMFFSSGVNRAVIAGFPALR